MMLRTFRLWATTDLPVYGYPQQSQRISCREFGVIVGNQPGNPQQYLVQFIQAAPQRIFVVHILEMEFCYDDSE